jgi:hypothetical protein
MIPELRAEFEKVLAMISSPEAQTATLDQMERSLLGQVLRLGGRLLQAFIDGRSAGESHAVYRRGRKSWPYHSQKAVDYVSVFGALEVQRAYFYALTRGGHCPLDAALSLPERSYSDLLMESAALLAVDGAYAKAVEVLERLLRVSLSVAAVETGVAEQAAEVEAFYAEQAPPPVAEEGPILVVQADGKGVPMVRPTAGAATDTDVDQASRKVRRGKGDKKTRKKEAIATAVYTLDRSPRTPQQLADALFRTGAEAEPEPRPAPRHKRVFASLDGKATALDRLAIWVGQRDGDGRHIRDRVALTDGSHALQDQTHAHLPGFTRVLDIMHVSEYAWNAGTALYGETDPQRAVWVEVQMRDILASQVQTVIDRLEAKAARLAKRSQAYRVLRQVANYFRRNRPFMDYATYLRRGWPIGTGVIEGACRHLVKDRMELAGMRWTVPGATAVLALRAVNENGDWEAFHAFRRERRHIRLYRTAMPTAWIAHAERLEIN